MSTTYTAEGTRSSETPVNDSVFDAPTEPSEPTPTEPGVKADVVEGEIVRNDEVAQRPEWDGDHLEFKGDTLEIKVPEQQALAAFSLASGRFVPMAVKNDIVGLFVIKHLSSDSYAQVMSRLMTPDDDEYTPETIGELMRAIVNISVEREREQQAAEDAKSDAPTT